MHQMRDTGLAEAYCDRVYEAQKTKKASRRGGRMVRQASIGPEVDYDIYLTLIQVGREPQVDMC